MGLISSLKTLFLAHLFLGYVFIVSGFIINFLQFLTFLFIWPWNKTRYRKIVSNLGYIHWAQLVSLGQYWSGSKCSIQMSNPYDLRYYGKEHSIVLMNHTYDIDWLMTWLIADRLGLLGGTRIYGKSSLRYFPLIGWAWVFVECIFLYRSWEKDKEIIQKGVEALSEYPDDYWITLLLFPEGTRFTKAKHSKSMEVARQKGMPELKHHLFPRTKGFVSTMMALKESENKSFAAIYDLTVAFRPDGAEPTLMNILNGKACKSEIYARRIPIEDVPTDSEESCAAWLHKVFREKDEVFDDIKQNGRFTIGTRHELPWRPHDLLVSVFWLVVLGVPFFWFIGSVFLSGSFTSQVVMICVIVILSVLVRKMIAVTEIKKGSSYGSDASKDNIANNNKKEN